MEIKTKNGKVKTQEELLEEAVELMVDEGFGYCNSDDLLDVTNEARENIGYDKLYPNEEDELNEQLEDADPYQLLCCGNDSWSSGDYYFRYDGWDLYTTDDLWEDLDEEEVARDLLTEDFVPDFMPREIANIIDEYKEALEELENYNPYRAMCEEVVKKYVNCEADVTDLLQTLDKLARTDEAWGE